MALILAWLLALSLAWPGAASTKQQVPASAASRLFLEIQSVAEGSAVETQVSEAMAVISRVAEKARERIADDQTVVPDHAAKSETVAVVSRAHQQGVDTSWGSALVIIPCLIVGSPLLWIWYHLDAKGDEIFTATDADLREVEISRVGASGVALLRRQCDRHTGIMFAFTGIMLQTIFMYFIAVACVQRIRRHDAMEDTSAPTPLPLLFCSLFCNTMVCCTSLILGLKCWATSAPPGYQQLHEALVALDSFVIPLTCGVVGSFYLCTSRGISSLVFNATAMAFICSINMQIAGLMSWSLSGHGGRAFQPANVSIKDSANSTRNAQSSLVASAVVATVAMPLGILFGII